MLPNESSRKKKVSGYLGTWNPVPPDEVLFGSSSAMVEVRHRASKISHTNIPVLLTGEGGTGKEAIGAMDPRQF